MSDWLNIYMAKQEADWIKLLGLVQDMSEAELNIELKPNWSIKSVLAHLAFWEETAKPVVESIYRSKPEIAVSDWYGGNPSEIDLKKPWPSQDVHNSREASWALTETKKDIIGRLKHSYQISRFILLSITTEESLGPIGDFYNDANRKNHLSHHTNQIIQALEQQSNA